MKKLIAALALCVTMFAACKDKGRIEGADAFKAFVAGLPDGKLKADGRAVLVGWLALLDSNGIQGADYARACAVLEADALGV